FESVHRGELEVAERRCQEALDAGRGLAVPDWWTLPYEALACVLHSQIAVATGAFREAAQVLLEAAERTRASKFGFHRGFWLASAASALSTAGDRDAAIPIATEGLELARGSGQPSAIAFSLCALAQALADSAPERARALLRESMEVS